MRTLALDVGDERTGVAISDELGMLARPLEMIPRRPGPGGFKRIASIVSDQNVVRIIVGLPLLPSGGEGKQARSTRAFVRGLRSHIDVPIEMRDESYTSLRAQEILRAEGRSRKRRKGQIDAVAAAVILQEYLDEQAETQS